MKILIGTPIHVSKDYSIERWLENVSKLTYPADLLIVDNSPGLEYMKKVKKYCSKYGIRPDRNLGQSPISNGVKNYKIKHLELPPEQKFFERLNRSREIIRQEVLSKGYDAWFSWESDQLIPPNALDELIKLMNAGDFAMVDHNNWTREIPNLPNFDWGVALISRKALEKYSFILDFGTDPEMPDTWEPSEAWFRKRVIRDGDGFLEVDGVIKPIYHLN